jgi:hypothetical protein
MGVVTNYADVVRDILTRVAGHLQRIPKLDVDTLLVEDPVQAIFMLWRVGWHAGKRVNNTVIFARIRNGKVWIEDDHTDLTFYDELVRAGVPKSDIVLGFHAPEERRFGEFAVA